MPEGAVSLLLHQPSKETDNIGRMNTEDVLVPYVYRACVGV